MAQKVIVVGGGVIGFLTALELAKADVEVVLLEKGQTGREASWAGGGIVSPLYPWRYTQPVTQLAIWAQEHYPILAEELHAISGIDPELNQCGLMMLDAVDELEALTWAEENDRDMLPIDQPEIYQREPELRPGFNKGLWMPQVSNIRNPRFLKALKACLLANKRVTLIEDSQVVGFEAARDKVKGVITNHDSYQADATIIAAGAWSAQLLSSLGVTLPVEPVRGQMLLFKDCGHLLSSIVLTQGKYLIPRLDGRVLIGSTLEKVGFDKRTTEEAKSTLLKAAYQLVPALEDYPLEAHWAGLRPAAPEGVPFIGAVPRYGNLYINAGHYRNGLVLAPASARLMADIILQRQGELRADYYALSEYL